MQYDKPLHLPAKIRRRISRHRRGKQRAYGGARTPVARAVNEMILTNYFRRCGTAVQSKGAQFERRALRFVQQKISDGAFGFIPEQTLAQRGVFMKMSMGITLQADILIQVRPPWYKPMNILVECKDTIAAPGVNVLSQLAWKVRNMPAIGGILITATMPSKRGILAAGHDNIAIIHYDRKSDNFTLMY